VKYIAQSVCGAYCCHVFANLLLHIFLLHCLLFFFLLLSFELLIIIDLCYNFLDDKVGSAKSTTPKDKTYSKSTVGRGTTNFPANPYFCTHAWDTKLQESLVHRLIFEWVFFCLPFLFLWKFYWWTWFLWFRGGF
jgi:hypothetical protein